MALNRSGDVAFLSTYPPRECGLATFTQDLIRELDRLPLLNSPRVVAVSNGTYAYESRVMLKLAQHDRESYEKTAKKLNDSNIGLLVIQHEYGIFGGECGEYLLDLIDHLQMPFVTTLHTVLPEPLDKQRQILQTLGKKSAKVITMARNSVKILQDVYGIAPDKIAVIPHGVPVLAVQSRDSLKEQHGLKDRRVISTFGLISPGKGLEYGIEAVAKVAKKHPDVLYLILGQTHPCVQMESGEAYREQLEDLVDRLGIRQNVRFVNRYLTQEEIIHYLQLSDIYMTPYLGKDQAVSGTLAYAVGYGKVIVSTPYRYAEEMLAEGRGLLAGFKDSHSLAECMEYVLDHPEEKRAMEEKTLRLGRTMAWDQVAKQYGELFLGMIQKSEKAGSLVG